MMMYGFMSWVAPIAETREPIISSSCNQTVMERAKNKRASGRCECTRTAVREVRRSRQDYLAGRLAHRYNPGHVATLPPAEWTAQPPLDDRSRRAGAGFLNLPLPRCSGRAGVGFPGVMSVLKGHNSLPPEHVCRRLQFVAEPLEFDAATMHLATSSPQVTALQQRRLCYIKVPTSHQRRPRRLPRRHEL
ncbi:hypothetical protein HPB52_021329 [Rhipicephalus sanguineus]|uniref:Uncharacterized protein n=1 Tax=Rhipicephalus sanguineus TaxID=34632 RepID=A0A9D4SN93_RHISA|nr:hypothetical protein HPB52_021329 [Rhipicephalus sanguineus]